jgi:hypothetical protein
MVDGDETAPGDEAFFLALAAKGKETRQAAPIFIGVVIRSVRPTEETRLSSA